MAVVAVLTAVVIVISSLRHKETQRDRFIESVNESDSLLTKSYLRINEADSVTIGEFSGNDVVVVFWASWSEKSDQLLQEIHDLANEESSLKVVSALVLDATDDISQTKFLDGFVHIDGASLFNDLKVPGIPSYILLDKNGNLKYAHVGYQENAGYELLRQKLNE